MTRLYDTVTGAIDDLDDWLKDNPGEDPGDAITEIADGATPIYTADALEMALDNLALATVTPDLGCDDEPTAYKLIALNIFEYITEQLHRHYQDNRAGFFYCERCETWVDDDDRDEHPDFTNICRDCTNEVEEV